MVLYELTISGAMAEGGLLDWQARLGMTLIGAGSISLFLSTKDFLPSEGVFGFIYLLAALLGLLMLMLSIGVDSNNPRLSEMTQLAPDELVETIDKIIGKEEEE
ncbi:MAG: hypothetical protein O3B67_02090 [archaeon]|nr:hypothetical protein [archaeon]